MAEREHCLRLAVKGMTGQLSWAEATEHSRIVQRLHPTDPYMEAMNAVEAIYLEGRP